MSLKNNPLININNSTDPFYRYKREKAIVKDETYRTVLVNFVNICTSIEKEPSVVASFIKYKLNNNVTMKKDIWFINSKVNGVIIDQTIDEFINLFVICPKCEIPETNFITDAKKQEIQLVCRSCSNIHIIANNFGNKKYLGKFFDYVVKSKYSSIINM